MGGFTFFVALGMIALIVAALLADVIVYQMENEGGGLRDWMKKVWTKLKMRLW